MSELDDLLADLTCGDDVRAETAAVALAERGQSALPALQKLLHSSDVDQRWWAVRVLAQLQDLPLAWLLQALDDPELDVRQAATLALISHPDPEAVPALTRTLSDPDSLLSGLASNALIAIGTPAVPALLDAFQNEKLQQARINALRALAEIADPQTIPVLMSAVQEDSLFIQHWAEQGLNKLGQNMVYIKPD
jgi:hypothetical protein